MELVGYDDVEARSHEVFSFVVVHSKVSSPLYGGIKGVECMYKKNITEICLKIANGGIY